ncbi:translin [Lutzomyia longipalpis]|uniref:Translin n=1 Tax=Lutzomyia longipalpis TaxID=7200 RepID=A0A1B0CQW3_LUTLO|nr:translin [Lutzomyia longipalpis]
MQNQIIKNIFTKFQESLNKEQELREEIRIIVREIDQSAKEAAIALQIMHTSIAGISQGCLKAREHFAVCQKGYRKLAEIVPAGQYYRYSDHWHYLTQKLVSLVALTVYLEAGFLVARETVGEVLGLELTQANGFHLELEDYLIGVLQMVTELARFAVNSVTLGDYQRPLMISRFVADINAGYRLLNLKNDGLRKRFDALKYDVKKIEEIVYDVSIRGLVRDAAPPPPAVDAAAADGAEEAKEMKE